MTDSDTLGLMVMLLCLAASMFFSASETAIVSFGERRAQQIQEEGGREARIVAAWVKDPVRVLSTILVGNNLVNTLLGSVATAIAIRHLGGGEWGEYAVAVAVLFSTGVLLVFGEILPKALGRQYSHRFMLPTLVALNVLGRVLHPIIWLLTTVTRLMLPKTAEPGSDVFHRVTPEEIDYLVKVGQREGSIPADQAALLHGIFRFEGRIVRDLMVPRNQVTAIDLAWDVDRVLEVARRTGHSRMPVYENTLDDIKGVLHLKQLIGVRDPSRDDIARLMRTPMFVGESTLAQDLLQLFKERRVHLGVVVDDGGRTVGVVTLEDVLEQIVGPIFDETDRAPVAAQGRDDGSFELGGQESLTGVEERFGVEFEGFDGVTSVGDLLVQLAGQMPVNGSVFVYEGIRFKVLAADARRVIRVRVDQIDIEDDDD